LAGLSLAGRHRNKGRLSLGHNRIIAIDSPVVEGPNIARTLSLSSSFFAESTALGLVALAVLNDHLKRMAVDAAHLVDLSASMIKVFLSGSPRKEALPVAATTTPIR